MPKKPKTKPQAVIVPPDMEPPSVTRKREREELKRRNAKLLAIDEGGKYVHIDFINDEGDRVQGVYRLIGIESWDEKTLAQFWKAMRHGPTTFVYPPRQVLPLLPPGARRQP